MKEPMGYRERLAELNKLSGGIAMLPIGKVAPYLGIDSRTLTNDETFPKKKVGRNWYVPVTKLAYWLES